MNLVVSCCSDRFVWTRFQCSVFNWFASKIAWAAHSFITVLREQSLIWKLTNTCKKLLGTCLKGCYTAALSCTNQRTQTRSASVTSLSTNGRGTWANLREWSQLRLAKGMQLRTRKQFTTRSRSWPSIREVSSSQMYRVRMWARWQVCSSGFSTRWEHKVVGKRHSSLKPASFISNLLKASSVRISLPKRRQEV